MSRESASERYWREHLSPFIQRDEDFAEAGEIAEPPVKRCGQDVVSLTLQVKDDLSRAGRMPCALAIDSVKDVGHRVLEL